MGSKLEVAEKDVSSRGGLTVGLGVPRKAEQAICKPISRRFLLEGNQSCGVGPRVV